MNFPNWLSRLLPARIARRRFEAAQYNRLTASWNQSVQSINNDLRGDLDALRGRSRDLAKNEPMARKFLSLVEANIVGPNGFSLQSLAADGAVPDTWARNAIEAAFADWGRPGICEPTGRHSFNDLVRQCVRALARDGEILLRIVEGAANAYGFQVQLLDIERLATWMNRAPAAGQNAIIMGVEIGNSGQPVAYHLVVNRYGDDPQARSTQRVDARQIMHLFICDDPEQMRGVPWMHAAMIRMHHMKGYQEAAIIAARVGASKMGFFVNPEGTMEAVKDGEDAAGVPFTEVDPGQFGSLPEGWDFKPFNPDYPHQMYGEFIKAAKRDIASALNVAYHALANDLEGVNFSSIRSGTLEERDHWMMKQGWVIDHMLTPIYARWLDNALLASAILLPNGSALPVIKKQKFLAHKFLGRRWQWVDPLKDINASVTALENNLQSPYTIAAQQGVDVEDVIDDIARFRDYATAKGVPLPSPQPAAAAPENTPADDVEDADEVDDEDGAPGQAKTKKSATDILTLALARSLDRPAPAAPNVTIHQGAVTVHTPETRVDVQPANVQVDVQPAEVRVEAIIPASEAPVVNVQVDAVLPEKSEVSIVSLPDRRTTGEVDRDPDTGEIRATSQLETDI